MCSSITLKAIYPLSLFLSKFYLNVTFSGIADCVDFIQLEKLNIFLFFTIQRSSVTSLNPSLTKERAIDDLPAPDIPIKDAAELLCYGASMKNLETIILQKMSNGYAHNSNCSFFFIFLVFYKDLNFFLLIEKIFWYVSLYKIYLLWVSIVSFGVLIFSFTSILKSAFSKQLILSIGISRSESIFKFSI